MTEWNGEVPEAGFADHPEQVVLFGEFAEDVIYELYGKTSGNAEFDSQFEILTGTHLAKEDYYQGLTVMSVIRRKADGLLFGYEYWQDISKNGESYLESNGYEKGYRYLNYSEHDPEVYVFEPVETFPITGYRHKGNNNG